MGLQYRNSINLNNGSGGYAGEWYGVSYGGVANWTETSGGNFGYSVYYTDSDNADNNNSTRVQITARDEITNVRRDEDTNRITFHIRTVVTEVKRYQRRGYAGNWGRKIDIYDREGGRLVWSSGNRPVNGEAIYFSGSMVIHDQDVVIEHGQGWNSGSSIFVVNSAYYANGQLCTDSACYDYIRMGLSLRNTLPAAPYAPAFDFSCGRLSGRSGGNVSVSVKDWGCPAGNSCSYSSVVQWATDKDFKNIISTGTGDRALNSNTKYYTRATVSNGHKTAVKTCEFTTLATSAPYNYKYISDQVSTISVNANYGGGACAISTVLKIREKGTSAWKDITTTSVHGVETETMRGVVVRGKKYEAITVTTNCAGTYTSPIYEFAPPAADSIVGTVLPPDSELNGLTATTYYCYTVNAYTVEKPSEDNPVTSHLEYRLVGQKEWTTLDADTSFKASDKHCGSIEGLSCGSTYEFRSFQKIGKVSSYSPVVLHDTPQCPDIHNCVCDNLGYMNDLICQELNGIKNGEKTIYANCQTKSLCDPYSMNPTWESILSRLVRFDEMAACIVCEYDMGSIGNGEDDEVYTATKRGEYGQFVSTSKKVEKDDDNLVSSGAVKSAIDEFINGIWHIIGIYGYFAESLADLNKQGGANGDTAVIGNKLYKRANGKWTESGTVPKLSPMASISILKGTWADHEYYWWDDKWNVIDINTKAVEKRAKKLEDDQNDLVYNKDAGHKYNILVASWNANDDDIVRKAQQTYGTTRDVVVFLVDGEFVDHPFILDISQLNGTDVLV